MIKVSSNLLNKNVKAGNNSYKLGIEDLNQNVIAGRNNIKRIEAVIEVMQPTEESDGNHEDVYPRPITPYKIEPSRISSEYKIENSERDIKKIDRIVIKEEVKIEQQLDLRELK